MKEQSILGSVRGRVRQKASKNVTLVTLGNVRYETEWHNNGYIFPEGYCARVHYRSSVLLDQSCIHECSVLGEEGTYWPLPTFRVVAMDEPDRPLLAKTCTGCWRLVLKRICSVIEAKRRNGEELPKPPKTAIAGPEYFGFNQAEIQKRIEDLDPQRRCELYWKGKAVRAEQSARLPNGPANHSIKESSGGPRKQLKRRRRHSSEDETTETDECDEEEVNGSRWSGVLRHERHKVRSGGEYKDDTNPLPGWTDPITLDDVVTPAISPYGHIMGMATWKAVLTKTSKCPFTRKALTWEQCQILTHQNLEKYKGGIIAEEDLLRRFGLL